MSENEQATLSEWTKTAPLKKTSMSNQLAHGEGNLKDGLEKDLVLRTKNLRALAGRRLSWKRLLEKAKVRNGLSSR
ncbi:hypothetical protein TNCV_3218281 [Trichonephila clavipes]|nr:hypothetical protein TNCV_3218281 [Trichonephila clavipes]